MIYWYIVDYLLMLKSDNDIVFEVFDLSILDLFSDYENQFTNQS